MSQDTDHLVDELARVDLLLRHHVRSVRASQADGDRGGGLYVSDAEVDRLLRPDRSPRPAGDDDLQDRLATVTEEVRERRDGGESLRLVELAERFDLSHRQVDALLLSLAPEFDRKYERVYAYLQDDITQTRPSVGLVTDVLTDDESERLATRPLVGERLCRLSPPDPDAPLLAHAVTADQRVVGYLLGRDDVDPAVADVVQVVEPETAIEALPVDDATRERVTRLAPAPGDPPAMRYVHGPYGAGTGEVVAAMCQHAESELLRAEASVVVDADVTDPLERLRREARLRDAAVHVANVHELDGDRGRSIESVARRLDGFESNVFLTGEDEWTHRRGVDDHEFAAVHLPRPGYDRRQELWADRAETLPDEVDPGDLAATFRLTRGQMDDAIETAHALGNGDGLTSETVYRGCRVQSRETLDALARKSETNYGWGDLVLPAEEKTQLREVAAHVKHRGTVYADWGFEDRFSLGTGLNVLFSGPSGTGKTMAAEIIAGDAGLDMFKIDLATVVSKYIGETEENLKQVFDEAEHTDAILFFDEADALFGERSEVSDATDRYANVEVSYLLQRMEEHDGTVILASNYKDNIDDAFLRRINTNVEFPRPDRKSRAAIWETIFPEDTPVGDLDVGFLSTFEITGGNIKNVALTASFLAADDGVADGGAADAVEMGHVVRALRRELQKTGRLVNPEAFGEYRDVLEH
jgi:AAA+ superfamily predicted ATPase